MVVGDAVRVSGEEVGLHQYRELWLVEIDDPATPDAEILVAPGLPTIGMPYLISEDPPFFDADSIALQPRIAARDFEALVVQVTVDYVIGNPIVAEPSRVWFVNEVWPGREGSDGSDYAHRYQRVFQVYTSAMLATAKEVLNRPEIPALFSTWKQEDDDGTIVIEDKESVCVARRASQTDADNPQNWFVTVEYEGVGTPLTRPADVVWGLAQFQRPIQRDLGRPDADPVGDPVDLKNSAGNAFDPPVEIDDSRLVLTITRFEATFDPLRALAFADTVNKEPFFGFDARQAKIANIGGERVYENGRFYWRVRYEIHFRRDAWLPYKILDQGFNEITGVDPNQKLRPMYDPASGSPYGSQQLLDGEGAKLAIGGEPVYLEFWPYLEKDFGELNLEALGEEAPLPIP